MVRRSHRFSFRKMLEAKMVFQWLDARKRDAILDVASGLGYHCYEIAGAGCDVYGLDLDKRSTRLAYRISEGLDRRPHYVTGDAQALPFKEHVFDKVICVCALEHIDDDVHALREISRVLKPQGTLVLTVESWTGRVDAGLKRIAADCYDVKHFYSLSSLTELLVSEGFDVSGGEYFLNSPLSALLYELEFKLHHHALPRRFRLGYLLDLLCPLTYVLSSLSDRLWGDSRGGYQLGVHAIKVGEEGQ